MPEVTALDKPETESEPGEAGTKYLIQTHLPPVETRSICGLHLEPDNSPTLSMTVKIYSLLLPKATKEKVCWTLGSHIFCFIFN